MAKLVSQTALAYRLADHRHWPKTLPPIPADLPGGSLEHHVLDHDHDHDHHNWDGDDHHSRHASHHDHHHGVASGIHAGHHSVAVAAAALPESGGPVRSVLAGASAVVGPAAAATAGLGTGVAGAAITGHVIGHSGPHGGADTPDPTGSAAAPPMGGAGITTAPAGVGGSVAAMPGAASAGHFRPVDGATSWSTGETTPWLEDDIDPPPPAVIGPTVH
jgi:hypothetical protein